MVGVRQDVRRRQQETHSERDARPARRQGVSELYGGAAMQRGRVPDTEPDSAHTKPDAESDAAYAAADPGADDGTNNVANTEPYAEPEQRTDTRTHAETVWNDQAHEL